jgi:hypothetical protein
LFKAMGNKQNKGKDLKAGKSKKKKVSRARRPSARRSPARNQKTSKRGPVSARQPKGRSPVTRAKQVKGKAPVTRARAASPARSTHGLAAPKRRAPLPSPMPMRHVAPPRPALVTPARSMPPGKELRRSMPGPAPAAVRAPSPVPDFAEAGVLLAITYSIREGRRGEFFDLMRELKPLLVAIGGADVTIYEDRSRPNYLM